MSRPCPKIEPESKTSPPSWHDPRYERWRWIVFGITWLAYVGYYFTRKSFAVAKVGILDAPTMVMSKSSMGLIDTGFGIASAIGNFV